MDECIVHPTSRMPLLAADGNLYWDPELDNIQRVRDVGALGCKWNVLSGPSPKG